MLPQTWDAVGEPTRTQVEHLLAYNNKAVEQERERIGRLSNGLTNRIFFNSNGESAEGIFKASDAATPTSLVRAAGVAYEADSVLQGILYRSQCISLTG